MNEKTVISVEHLTREFRIADGKPGMVGSIMNLFSRRSRIIKAVDDISFAVAPGEFVGYVGENGAGKSTTIKMLTGILTPTSGKVEVAGIVPHTNRVANAFNIGVVFGQRTQLWWDLPVRDSFDLLRSIYRVPRERFERNYRELAESLDLGPLLKVPVRKLSLGQRMRCDFAAALLHGPRILFLDEPTIGLDIIAKDHVRKFLKRVNALNGMTVILTTHDMDDIEALCGRIILIDKGRIAYDGAMSKFKADHARYKILEVEFHDSGVELKPPDMLVTMKVEANKAWFRLNPERGSMSEAMSLLFRDHSIKDISIQEPKVEGIVKEIYENRAAHRAGGGSGGSGGSGGK